MANQSRALGNRDLQPKFCPECGELAENMVCDAHGKQVVMVASRTLKYTCRMCGSPAANQDKFCRYCGLEHING